MTGNWLGFTLAAAVGLLSGAAVPAQRRGVRVVFVEPAGTQPAPDSPVYRIVTDPSRVKTLEGWLGNESARMALDLFERAWALSAQGRSGEGPTFYVALVPGGNNAAVGLRLVGDHDSTHARTSYLKLAPEDWAFSTTFLHETGHVILSMLNRGTEIPKREIASISHTTAALTDRGTAFDEGFAIHLETLAAHFTTDPFLTDRYQHRRFRFGVADPLGEYHRHAGDLLSFAQTIARYHEVKENDFAFAPAFTGPDYLRVQLEKSRDFATLRDANQLLQSEGYQASFFFGLLMRGNNPPTAEIVRERQQRVLIALAEMFGSARPSADDPFLLRFVEAYTRRFPDEADEIIDVLLDSSHGVFVDRGASALWRDHYLGALKVDLAERDNSRIESARKRWHEEAARDPRVLHRNIGPQIRAEVIGPIVRLVALEASKPVSFDINTVEPGVMRLVPGITEAEIASWLESRDARWFESAEDFSRRAGSARPRWGDFSSSRSSS